MIYVAIGAVEIAAASGLDEDRVHTPGGGYGAAMEQNGYLHAAAIVSVVDAVIAGFGVVLVSDLLH